MFYSLDQFEIASKSLGSGTYGDVKMGKATKNKTKYALKVINTSKLRPAEVKAIEREIQVHRKLEHPNIIKFHQHFYQNKNLVMVLNYAQNGCLADYLY